MKNKIGWCDMTWNPVWGCRNHCEYCYARKIAKRFAGKMAEKEIDNIYGGNIDSNSLVAFYDEKKEDIKNFRPTFLTSQFDKKLPKNPQRIFAGSMSEIAFWEKIWVEKIIEKTKQYPQHIFQFLTKFPAIYQNYKFPENCWLGITLISEMTKENCWSIAEFESHNKENLKFISLEPLMEKIDLNNCVYSLKNISWIIVGAETGNRKGKVIPKKEWVFDIMKHCNSNKISLYIKNNLGKYYPDLKYIKEFPNQ